MIVRVIVEIGVGLDREFDYLVPPELMDRVCMGTRVITPFGAGNREVRGTVVGMDEESGASQCPNRRTLKTLLRVCDAEPLITPRLMELARWMAGYYAAPLESAVRSLLPVAVRDRSRGLAGVRMAALAPEREPPGRPLTAGQTKVLEWLRAAGGGPLPLSEVARAAGVKNDVVLRLARRGKIIVSTVKPDSLSTEASAPEVTATMPLSLMPQQQQALDAVLRAVARREPPVVLLHGVTGSGKTEVYLQAIAEVLAGGGSAMMLVPEIALTPQTVERFRGRFGATIAVMHSHLAAGDRYEQWHRIRSGCARVAVGARSAVFAPLRNPGLIVVDEEHEPSYKQEESPRYQARDVAVMRGRLESCAVVLGSATPSLESYFNARNGKYGLVEMLHRVDHRQMPRMHVVDMRIEAQRRGGGLSVFSRVLLESLERRLDRGEQTMLFLNRRGYATSLICPACGFVAECEACSLAMTYHRTDDTLVCHWCAARRRVPGACPQCRDPSFKYAGIGTQRVETALRKLCPKARIVRMDRDTTHGKNAYERILGDFRRGAIDVLVGTQMIAKGLDFPNVTLIGVIQADMGLHMPDFRAAERTFQLLTQVAGRAGRGDIPGDVVIQTFTPYHEAVQAARRLDYAAFFDREIEFRRELQYPPHARISRVVFSGPDETVVAAYAARAGAALRAAQTAGVVMTGPAPAPMARVRNVYRYHLLMRSAAAVAMNRTINSIVKTLKKPRDITVTVDVDAQSVM